MYIKDIQIEGVGPIERVKIDLPFHGDGRPKPLVVVGENGSGKTILLSYVVNALLAAKQEAFEDSEVEKGKVFKLRSPNYIRSESDYAYSSIRFNVPLEVEEVQLRRSKQALDADAAARPVVRAWGRMGAKDTTLFWSNFHEQHDATVKLFQNNCCLYFPVNRFEEPAWLNADNLTARATYLNRKHIEGVSERNVICDSPLKSNRNWLLDVVLDRELYERKAALTRSGADTGAPIFVPVDSYAGPSTTALAAINRLLNIALKHPGTLRIGVGGRQNRSIAVMRSEKQWIPNVFQLSTGETQLLNLFLSILRDYDLAGGTLSDLESITGVVVVDEIDAHLHAVLQHDVLPDLIAAFPAVQFVITTHSPLFLLGLERRLGGQNFEAISLPSGEDVGVEDFSEFAVAYALFKETKRYRDDVTAALAASQKPIVFVEGGYDVRYLQRAATLLKREVVLERVVLRDGGGYGNLDKIWKSFDNPSADSMPNELLLLYDCDVGRVRAIRGKVARDVIPTNPDSPIKKGIENLFGSNAISKAEAANQRFIDVKAAATIRIRGELVHQPEEKSVNRDEKDNLCTWFCEHGDASDFAAFNAVLDRLEEFAGRPAMCGSSG